MAAATAWRALTKFKELLGEGSIDLEDDAFDCMLMESTWTPDLDTDEVKANVSAQETGDTGYGGEQTLGTKTWNQSTTAMQWDSANIVFAASGSDVVVRYALIYDETVSTPVVDPLVCYCILDSAPADVTITDGNSMTIQVSNILTLDGATT